MNPIRLIVVVFCLFVSSLYAVGEPLIVGISRFTPPFIFQGSNNSVYGFDVDLMNSLCTQMRRTCQFQIMKFNQLLPALVEKKIDVAISAITITPERGKLVNFTIPYLPSMSRFLARKSSLSDKPFTLEALNNKRFGIEPGTIFETQIKTMGIKNPELKLYDKVELQLEALRNNEVDFIILDNPEALYWEANSDNLFVSAGPPFEYGLGLGIAVNKANIDLLQVLNSALTRYINSAEYKTNYNQYLNHF